MPHTAVQGVTSEDGGGGITCLDPNGLDQLSDLLDSKSSDWRRLAHEFDLSPLIPTLESDSSKQTPTTQLLNYLEVSVHLHVGSKLSTPLFCYL